MAIRADDIVDKFWGNDLSAIERFYCIMDYLLNEYSYISNSTINFALFKIITDF